MLHFDFCLWFSSTPTFLVVNGVSLSATESPETILDLVPNFAVIRRFVMNMFIVGLEFSTGWLRRTSISLNFSFNFNG